MKIIWWVILTGLSAVCYRLGGSAKRGNWLDFARNSKVRDIGCSLLSLGLFIGQKGANWGFLWLYVIAFGLSWGALSTYWDWVTGKDNFYLHGLFCGLAFIPLHWAGLSWWVIGIRAIACAILMGLWSKIENNAVWEEFGRGFLFTTTIPLLFL